MLTACYILGFWNAALTGREWLGIWLPVLIMLGIEELNHVVVSWNSVWFSVTISSSVFIVLNLLFITLN